VNVNVVNAYNAGAVNAANDTKLPYPNPLVFTTYARMKYVDVDINPVAKDENKPVLNNPISSVVVETASVDVKPQMTPRRITS
jgi:hypothetical protein